MPRSRGEQKLLWTMGYELANVHLGTRGASAPIQTDLHRRKPKWLRQSAEKMAEVTLADWKNGKERPLEARKPSPTPNWTRCFSPSSKWLQ